MWPVDAVIAFEPDDLRAGEVVIEAQDVIDLGAAPAIDRLVVVADAADVFGVLSSSALRFVSRRASCVPGIPVSSSSPLTRLAFADPRPRFPACGEGSDGVCASNRSHKYCATLVS